MKIAVVILNYNGKHFLKQFLPSVLQYTEGIPVIVADNCSTDDSVEILTREFPQVTLIQNPTNEGFAGGYNTALRHVDAEYYVLLNSDAEVTPHWLSPLLELMESDSSIAACQPKLKSFHQKSYFEYAGAAGGYLDKWGYPFCRGRIFDTLEVDTGQYDDTRPVFWATGTCLVVRSAAFWQVGGFDATFFAHMEEIDLCWRLHHSGYQVFYCAQSTVYHVGGGTLPATNPRKTFLNFRNSLAMLYKNLPTSQIVPVIFLRLVLDGLAGIVFILQKKPQHCWAIIQAHFAFYKDFRFWMKQRKHVLRKELHVQKQIYRKSIIWKYFVRKRKKFSSLHF